MLPFRKTKSFAKLINGVSIIISIYKYLHIAFWKRVWVF